MSLEQIGQKLKAARETQGLSLRQIYERTKIPMGHLLSIDEAQADELPEPVYVAGYIKRYAECVGLNGQLLAEQYRKSTEDWLDNGKTQDSKSIGGQQVIYSAPEYFNKGKIDRGPPTFKTFYFNAFWIVVVVGLLAYLMKVQLNNQANQVDPSLMPLRDTTAKLNVAQQPAQNVQVQPAAETNQSHDARVSLSANQHVWVEVKSLASGENYFTGYMEQGDRRDYQDSQGLSVRAGNGGSLAVDYQGKVESFGLPGKVTERTFLAQSPALNSEPAKTSADGSTATSNPLATAQNKPALAAKKPAGKNPRQLSEAHERKYRRTDDMPLHQYIPGESLGGGTRSIDVPYRYND